MARLQSRFQQQFELRKMVDERRWADEASVRECEHDAGLRRRQELLDVYTRYQLAADRFENAVRDVASAQTLS